ncbi:MAG: type 1 glutamine amidotransferase [Betaproteobacteria bacterium]
MKPVLILQHMRHDGPAYLARWLADRGLAFDLRDAASGASFPADMSEHGALAVLGGAMSANDPLPFLRDAERLILQSMRAGIPVIGHCLGGQLMARALGARVQASPAPEIGWQPLQVLDDPVAVQWFGQPGQHQVMHWHYESFDLPPSARWLATSSACPHQAFAIGPHLGIQFHVEIDEAKLQRWLDDGDPAWAEALAQHAGSVQDKATILAHAKQRLLTHQRLADRLYGRWISGAARVSAS